MPNHLKWLPLAAAITVFSFPQFGQAQSAEKLNNGAVELYHEGKGEDALAVIEESLRKSPHNEISIANKSAILARMGRGEDAIAFLRSSLKLNPESVKLRRNLATFLGRFGYPAESARLQYILSAEGEEFKTDPQKFVADELEIRPEMVKPQPGEIRLDGLVLPVLRLPPTGFRNPIPDTVKMEALFFALPNGNSKYTGPKTKVLKFAGKDPEWVGLGPLPITELRQGDFIVAIGREEKSGFVARRIVVANRTYSEEKQRGSFFGAEVLPKAIAPEFPTLTSEATGAVSFETEIGFPFSSMAGAILRDGDRTALLTPLKAFVFAPDVNAGEDAPGFTPEKFASILTEITTVKGPGNTEELSKLEVKLPVRIPLNKPYRGGEIVSVAVEKAPASIPLATEPAKPGDIVFLQQWSEGKMRRGHGVVAYADAKRLFIKYDDSNEFVWQDGAVIVNAKGEVVGMEMHSTIPYIVGLPVGVLREAVQRQ